MMNAHKADTLLDDIDDILSRFGRTFGMRKAKNTHFEAINRELRWKHDNREKRINIEYTYTDTPMFEVSVAMMPLQKLRSMGRKSTVFPSNHVLRSISLPASESEIERLLLEAKTLLDGM